MASVTAASGEVEKAVARHYTSADLFARIVVGLKAAGADLNDLKTEDLSPVDEFHLGGRPATEFALEKFSVGVGQKVLDIGSGIGGAARFVAATTGAEVTGVDLTPEFVATARALSALTGLSGATNFEVASALAMPFEDATFDAALTIHVAMNIADRAGLYAEVARVIKPGAPFCIYDIMKKGAEPLQFPVPWAESEATSHLTTPEEMATLLDGAGFEVDEVVDRTEIALEFLADRDAAADDGPPPLGVHILLGANAREKFGNTRQNMVAGRIAPVLMRARRRNA